MCDIRKFPKLYTKADWFLRIAQINKAVPGYELLKRAIVVWVVEEDNIREEVLKLKSTQDTNRLIEEKLIERVEEIAPMAFSRSKVIPSKRNTTEQAMIEAIRSISKYGVKVSVLDFVTDIKEHMF